MWLLGTAEVLLSSTVLLPALCLHLGTGPCPRADSGVPSGEVLVLPLPEALVDTT